MKHEDSSLTGYLVKNLQPLTPADPVILAEYVIALLKKDKSTKELQRLCADNLVDFLGHSTNTFIKKLFQALEDGSVVRPVDNNDENKNSEHSARPAAVDPLELKVLPSKDEENSRSKKEHELSTSSRPASDPEDQEISDDDDDRNHKHRRRDSQPLSFDKDHQRQFIGHPRGKRNRTFENGELFQENHLRTNEVKREYNPSLDRELSFKYEKRRPGMIYSGPRFDSSTSFSRPVGGRGRGRGLGPWNQQDTRFAPLGALDFASHMASQGPTHPSLFVPNSLPNAASAQSASWTPFGFVPGMPNMCLDPLNPLGLQGAVHSSINSQLNLGMHRQRCRDFEEQGFCLRGDMCPMEHGVNRIVVDDVQSLSQFNLPGSVPSTHLSSQLAVSGTLNPNMNSNSLTNKSSKVGLTDESSIPTMESDVYDPDQPLWNNDHSEPSKGLLNLPPKVDGMESLWDADPSHSHGFKFSDGMGSEEPPSTSTTANVISQGKGTHDGTVTNTSGGLKHRKPISVEEVDGKAVDASSTQRFHKDSWRNTTRSSQKAFRTLFVMGIPQINNKKTALLSHFGKFGHVIHIHIPQIADKAFVQFSKREEAEAALLAPDAVMGNRFIKLFWANRDNIVDDKEGKEIATSVGLLPRADSAVLLKLSDTAGREPVSSDVQRKVSNVSTLKAAPTPKKRELELLKEELHKKQELLAQKRNDFRNQLNKLEKQAIPLLKEEDSPSKQPCKKLKSDTDAEILKTSIVKMEMCTDVDAQPESEKLNRIISRNATAFHNKNNSPALHKQSSKSSMQTNNLSIPSSVNRYKLDNRPTGFRILPPLPAGFSEVTVMKGHFSIFNNLSTVELEDPESKSSTGTLKSSQSCSACINFTTRRSAEKAFLGGKCWKGHNLQFEWLKASSVINHHSVQQVPLISNFKEVEAAGLEPQNVVSKPLSSPATSTSCAVSKTVKTEPVEEAMPKTVDANNTVKTETFEEAMPKAVDVNNTVKTVTVEEAMPKEVDVNNAREHMDVDSVDHNHESLRDTMSIPTISLPDKSPPKSDLLVVEDDNTVGFEH